MRTRFRADDAGPNEPVVAPSPLVDSILALLEEAGAPASVNDEVVRLVEAWEYERNAAEMAAEIAAENAAAEAYAEFEATLAREPLAPVDDEIPF